MRRGIKQKFNTTKTMQDLQAYYQSEFANFWAKSFPKESCPPLPKKLEDLGCCAVMPLISPIGSALGIRNEHNLELIKENCKCNLIVDAGIGKPSDAARVMEMGFDGVLLNSSVARALDPIEMAKAMKFAVIAGRKGYLSGLIEKDRYAKQTTMDEGKISNF